MIWPVPQPWPAFFAAADNHLPVHLVALLPLTDNRPGFNAYAADDILTMYDGTTVEVVNTDAEGRLILADAIAYAARNYNPQLIIDAATLTGAAVRAIGTYGIAAMQQGADNPLTLLKLVGNQVYERLVELPMWSDYDELLKSEVADLRNCGLVPQAGAITAGKFWLISLPILPIYTWILPALPISPSLSIITVLALRLSECACSMVLCRCKK